MKPASVIIIGKVPTCWYKNAQDLIIITLSFSAANSLHSLVLFCRGAARRRGGQMLLPAGVPKPEIWRICIWTHPSLLSNLVSVRFHPGLRFWAHSSWRGSWARHIQNAASQVYVSDATNSTSTDDIWRSFLYILQNHSWGPYLNHVQSHLHKKPPHTLPLVFGAGRFTSSPEKMNVHLREH